MRSAFLELQENRNNKRVAGKSSFMMAVEKCQGAQVYKYNGGFYISFPGSFSTHRFIDADRAHQQDDE